MNITITIDAPELVGAINNLATALGATAVPLQATEPTKEAPVKEAPVKDEPVKEQEPVKGQEPVKEQEPVKGQEPVKEQELVKEEPSISLEVVRGKLAAYTAEGKENQVKVKEALTALGVKKLTDVDPADYEQLLEQVGLTV